MKRYQPPPGWVIQAYRFALDPTIVQDGGLRRNTGAARFAFNHMLHRVSAVKAQRAAEASYGVAEADLTPWQDWSLPDLTVKPKLSLAERTYHCTACGMSLDRDVNAARNLAAQVRHVDLELPGDAKTGRGACVRPVRPARVGRAAGSEASRPSEVNAARQRTATDHALTNA